MNKLFSKIATLSVGLAMAIGVGVAVGSKGVREARAAEPDTNKYQKITAVSGLAAGDKAVLYNPTDSEGVTGTSGTKDASVAASGWLEYIVAKTTTGFTLQAGTNSYVTLGTKSFSHTADATDLSVTSNGYLCTVADADNILYRQNTYVRTYTGKSADENYHPFAVYKVLNSTPVQSYTITYDANGGSGEMADSTNTVSECSFTAPDGKKFSKWNTAADGKGTDYAPGATASSDLDLYAIWVDKPNGITIDTTSFTKVDPSASSYGQYNGTREIDGVDITSTDAMVNDSKLQLKKNSGYIANTTSGGVIKSITVEGLNNLVIYAAAEKFDSRPATGTTVTSGASNGYEYFALVSGGSNAGYATSVVVEFVESGKSMRIEDPEHHQGPFEVTYGDTSEYKYAKAYDIDEEKTIDSGCSWTISDPSVIDYTVESHTWLAYKPKAVGSTTITVSCEGYIASSTTINVVAGTLSSIAVSGSMSKTSYSTLESWSPAGLTVTATYSSGWEETVSSGVTWTYEPASPADGVTSVVATAHYEEETASSTAQTVSVTVMHAGTFADPYTVANARSAIDAGSGTSDKYAIGIVSEIVTDYSTEYKNISFNISTDGLTTSNQLQAFRCVSSTAHTISSNDDVEIGATVIVKGNLKNFHGTYEFDAGCTIESYTAPEKGDIEVTFNPTTSYEVGASATFAATTNPTGATLAWESNDPSVLSVNASTGAFEAVGVGVARVTVNATLGEQHGTAFADIIVNGSQTSPFSVSDVFDEITPSLDGTTAYYIYVSAYVKEFATSMSSANPPKPRAIDVVDFDEESRIMVYTNVDPYEGFIDGLSLGDQILVKAKVQKFVSGNTITYQLTQPEKISSRTSAMAFAFKLLELTDGKCETYVDGKSSYSEFKTFFEGVWDDAEAAYDALEAIPGEQAKVLAAEGDENGTVLEQAMARYDLLVAKYQLNHFVTSRAKIAYRGFTDLNILSTDNSMIIIISIASVSTLGLAMFLLFKKKKQK